MCENEIIIQHFLSPSSGMMWWIIWLHVCHTAIVAHVNEMSLWLWTAASNRPVHNPDDTSVQRAMVEWWQGKTKELGETPVPVPLCQQQISHGVTWAQTWASAVRPLTNCLSHGMALLPILQVFLTYHILQSLNFLRLITNAHQEQRFM
jgi:hypothetical protein